MKESELESDVCRWAVSYGGVALKLTLPQGEGFPDRTILLPGGKLIFSELKRPGGRIRRNQKRWIERLTSLGFVAGISYSIENLEELWRQLDRF